MNSLYADAMNISEESKSPTLNNASQISINRGREFQLVHHTVSILNVKTIQ